VHCEEIHHFPGEKFWIKFVDGKYKSTMYATKKELERICKAVGIYMGSGSPKKEELERKLREPHILQNLQERERGDSPTKTLKSLLAPSVLAVCDSLGIQKRSKILDSKREIERVLGQRDPNNFPLRPVLPVVRVSVLFHST
jgi:hypothetical protein